MDTQPSERVRKIASLAIKNNEVLLAALVATGTDLNATDGRVTPLMLLRGSIDHPLGVRELVKLGARVDRAGIYGLTPLHLAAQEGNILNIRELIALGAKADVEDEVGGTPMFTACL